MTIKPSQLKERLLNLFDATVSKDLKPSEAKAAVSAANTYLNIIKTEMLVAKHNTKCKTKINFSERKKRTK